MAIAGARSAVPTVDKSAITIDAWEDQAPNVGWIDDVVIATRPESTGRSNRPKIAAVEVDPAGCSYNPDYEQHQDAIAEAVAVEVSKLIEKELEPAVCNRFFVLSCCAFFHIKSNRYCHAACQISDLLLLLEDSWKQPHIVPVSSSSLPCIRRGQYHGCHNTLQCCVLGGQLGIPSGQCTRLAQKPETARCLECLRCMNAGTHLSIINWFINTGSLG